MRRTTTTTRSRLRSWKVVQIDNQLPNARQSSEPMVQRTTICALGAQDRGSNPRRLTVPRLGVWGTQRPAMPWPSAIGLPVRILIAASGHRAGRQFPLKRCRRTQVVNEKRLRSAGVGPSEVQILAATFLSVVERSRRLPVEEETHVRVVQGRLRDGGRAWHSHTLTEFSPESRCDGESSFVSPVMRTRRFESCPSHWPMTRSRRGHPAPVEQRPNSRPSHGRTPGSNPGWSILQQSETSHFHPTRLRDGQLWRTERCP